MGSCSLITRAANTLLLSGFLLCSAQAQDSTWQKDTAAWREEHKADLLKPDGWLALVGLEWLQPGDSSVGSAADNKIHLAGGPAHLAILHLEGETVTLNPPTGGFPPDFLVAGAPAKSQTLRAEANKDKVSPVSPSAISTCTSSAAKRASPFASRILILQPLPVFAASVGTRRTTSIGLPPNGFPTPRTRPSR